MVCDRCVLSVTDVLKKSNIEINKISLGNVVLKQNISEQKINEINKELIKLGFEIIYDEKFIIVEKIKTEIINLIYKDPETIEKTNISTFLVEHLNHDYTYLSSIFSKYNEITIEKYFILQKIERVKELISYNELNLTEISYKLGYKSSQHLSSQFKKITGLTPSEYKKQENFRKPLDKI